MNYQQNSKAVPLLVLGVLIVIMLAFAVCIDSVKRDRARQREQRAFEVGARTAWAIAQFGATREDIDALIEARRTGNTNVNWPPRIIVPPRPTH